MTDFSAKFYANFIKDDRWLGLVTGLKVTIIVTLGCCDRIFCSNHKILSR